MFSLKNKWLSPNRVFTKLPEYILIFLQDTVIECFRYKQVSNYFFKMILGSIKYLQAKLLGFL